MTTLRTELDYAPIHDQGSLMVRSYQTNARLAEVIASLSIATDLATGQPLEHGLRRALLAVWLAEDLGLSPEEASTSYYVALLGTVGCTIESAALSRFVHDEIAIGSELSTVDQTGPRMAAFLLPRVGSAEPPVRRAKKLIEVALSGPRYSQMICRDVALQLGSMLNLGESVNQALAQCHERWNGRGGPSGLKGEEISLAARIFHVAHDADTFNRLGGVDAAVAVARERSGRVYDPTVADRFCASASTFMRRLHSEATWEAVLEEEPAPFRELSPGQLDHVIETIANFVDLRSPFTFGHSHAVASLAEMASRKLGLSDGERIAVRRAGMLHDLGRTGVPVALWNKSGPLTGAEYERMRTHPSLTEVVLARSTALGHLGVLAGLHHERLDGSGYRGVPAGSLPVAARLLAAADAYETKLEVRPHRGATTPGLAAEHVRRLAGLGQLDLDVSTAVLVAAGHDVRVKPPQSPAGLTDRETEVLREIVRGRSNREIADALVVSPKTVGNHIQHIYGKIGVSTRVGATLFALQNGLADGSPEIFTDSAVKPQPEAP